MQLQRLQEVFLLAARAPTRAGRAEVLDRECSGDDELRRWATKLLRKHDLKDQALDTPVLDLLPTQCLDRPTNYEVDEITSGIIIAGRYRLIDRLGQGGMGEVYRAEQISPFRRTVAIKLIRPGFDSKSMLARFESERQALARMNHPGIAKVHDAGTIDGKDSANRPFFVMELIDGVPINQFCTRKKLTLRQRLELFIEVCHAIEHAHQKGMIHRDLKPGNILVAERDGRSVPVVIDFGVAKSIEGQIDLAAQQTGLGLFLGTLDYMAPEQAVGHSDDIDTRTDVYSLGAVLYELVTGHVPLDRSQVGEVSLFDLASVLREHEPMPPSRRAPAANSMSVVADIRVELDWIVLKCLEKDRDRRYPSSYALADDLSRFLANDPVSAGPPTVRYRLRKLVRRHWVPVTAASLVLLALIGGMAGAIWGMVVARRAEANALLALSEKEIARAAEEKERIRADAKAAQAKFISDFIQFDVLRQANPVWQFYSHHAPDGNLTVRTALDRAAATVEQRFADKPNIVAALYQTIGSSYDGLGDYVAAIKYMRRSFEGYEKLFGPEDERTLSIRHTLGLTLVHANRTAEAIPLFEHDLALIRAKYGPEHNKTMTAETDLANAFKDAGRYDDAERLLTHVYETVRFNAPNSAGTVRTLINLAGLDECRGRFAEAIHKIESLKDHLPAGQELDPLAKLITATGLGRFYLEVNRTDEGIRLLETARDSAQSMFGEDHFQFINTVYVLTDAYLETGRADDARQLLTRNRDSLRAKVGTNDARVHRYSLELARLEMETGNIERAESLARETETAMTSASTFDGPARVLVLNIRGRCLYLSNRAAEAEPLARNALDVLTAHKKNDCQTHEMRVLLGLILAAQTRFAEAKPELTGGYQALSNEGHRLLFIARRRLPEAIDALIQCADSLNHPEDAVKWRAERKRMKQTSRQPNNGSYRMSTTAPAKP